MAQSSLVRSGAGALWSNAMHSGKKNLSHLIFFLLNPDYVAARSLRSLYSNYMVIIMVYY